MKLLSVAARIIVALSALIMAVERPGDGAQKKKEVMDAFIKLVSEVDKGVWDIPEPIEKLVTNPKFLSVLIDLIVAIMNMFGKDFLFRSS